MILFAFCLAAFLYIYLLINYLRQSWSMWTGGGSDCGSSAYRKFLHQIISLLNGLHSSFWLNSSVCLISNYFMLNLLFTVITFVRLRQQAQLLTWTSSVFSAGDFRLQSAYLATFSRHHTATTNLTVLNSASFGSTILAFVLGCSLANSYFSYLIIFTDQIQSVITTAIIVNFLAMQWLLIGFIHLLAAQYSSRIYAPRRALFSWSAENARAWQQRQQKQPKQQFQMLWNRQWSLQFCLKLDGYASRLNASKRYGISYGRGLGLVSAQSFQRV